MYLKFIVFVFATISVLGCKKGVQPTTCPTSDNEAKLAALEAENQSLRELAKRRQEIFDDLKRKLSELIDSGRIRLVFRRSMIVMQLPNQVLFESGKAELKPEGIETVEAVGEAIADIDDRRFLVAGHTDNVPIEASKWRSNWHLSSARAQNVLKVFLDARLPGERFDVAGFGKYAPDADNDTEEGRALNRRTEIPNLEQIFNALKQN